MTSRKLMTLALATVLALNCGGLRAADAAPAAENKDNFDATLGKLAAELEKAESQAPAAPAAAEPAPAAEATAPSAPAPSAPVSAAE